MVDSRVRWHVVVHANIVSAVDRTVVWRRHLLRERDTSLLLLPEGVTSNIWFAAIATHGPTFTTQNYDRRRSMAAQLKHWPLITEAIVLSFLNNILAFIFRVMPDPPEACVEQDRAGGARPGAGLR